MFLSYKATKNWPQLITGTLKHRLSFWKVENNYPSFTTQSSQINIIQPIQARLKCSSQGVRQTSLAEIHKFMNESSLLVMRFWFFVNCEDAWQYYYMWRAFSTYYFCVSVGGGLIIDSFSQSDRLWIICSHLTSWKANSGVINFSTLGLMRSQLSFSVST